MAYIRVVDEDEAEGRLFDIYDEVQRRRGRLSNVMRAQSLDPKALKAHLDLYMEVVHGKGPLTRMQRELVAVVVSGANGCGYCVTHHGEALFKYVKDKGFVRQAARDHRKLDLGTLERAICDYAQAVTRDPGADHGQAVDGMRKAGLKDEGVLHAAEVVAYFNFVNRLVQGLGVELEQDRDRDYID